MKNIKTFEGFLNEAVTLKKGDIVKFKDGSSIYILGPKGDGYDYKDGRERGHHPKAWFDMMISSGKAVVESVEIEEIDEAMDFNDPVLIALRAAQQNLATKKAKAALDKKRRVYGKQRDALEDKLWEISIELKELTKEKSQLYADMDAEAGQMGAEWSDNDANRYGEELNRVESKIEELKAKRSEIETKLSY